MVNKLLFGYFTPNCTGIWHLNVESTDGQTCRCLSVTRRWLRQWLRQFELQWRHLMPRLSMRVSVLRCACVAVLSGNMSVSVLLCALWARLVFLPLICVMCWTDWHIVVWNCASFSFLQADSFSHCQEILYLLWKTKFRYRVHSSPPLASIQSRASPFHVAVSCFRKIHFNIILT
jgi:hypothetical protein